MVSSEGKNYSGKYGKKNIASLATLAKKIYCPDIVEAITPYKIPGRILPNPVLPPHWSSGRNNVGNITEAWLKRTGKTVVGMRC